MKYKINNKILKLEYITRGYPAQWEGKFTDGREFYVHFRHGILSIYIKPNDSTDDIIDNKYLVYEQLIGIESGEIDEKIVMEKLWNL